MAEAKKIAIGYIRVTVQNNEPALASPIHISIIRANTEQINQQVNRNQDYTFAVTPGEYQVRASIGIVVSDLVSVKIEDGQTSEMIVFKF